MKEFKGTKNWRIREHGDMFFIEGDLDNASTGHYPRVEVMMEDFGDHNGYTAEMRMADAKLIASAPELLEALKECVYAMEYGDPNEESTRTLWLSIIAKGDNAIYKALGGE